MPSSTLAPLVIAFVADLMFTMRIAKVIEHLDYRVIWIESADRSAPSILKVNRKNLASFCMAGKVAFLTRLRRGNRRCFCSTLIMPPFRGVIGSPCSSQRRPRAAFQ